MPETEEMRRDVSLHSLLFHSSTGNARDFEGYCGVIQAHVLVLLASGQGAAHCPN